MEFMCKSLSGAGFLFLSTIWDCVRAFCSRAEKEEKVRLAHHGEVKRSWANADSKFKCNSKHRYTYPLAK